MGSDMKKHAKGMTWSARLALVAVFLATTPGLTAEPVPTKVHSFDVLAASATVCTDGARFDGQTLAASSVGLVMTSQVFNGAGTLLLGTGNTHTFAAVNEVFTFTVPLSPAAVNVGDTVFLSVTENPPTLVGIEGDGITATVANCVIGVPTMPGWALAALLLLVGAAGVTVLARRRSWPLTGV